MELYLNPDINKKKSATESSTSVAYFSAFNSDVAWQQKRESDSLLNLNFRHRPELRPC